jgi:hypothetical protein
VPPGLIAPTRGELLVCGESILREGGLQRARAQMGVCPQVMMREARAPEGARAARSAAGASALHLAVYMPARRRCT